MRNGSIIVRGLSYMLVGGVSFGLGTLFSDREEEIKDVDLQESTRAVPDINVKGRGFEASLYLEELGLVNNYGRDIANFKFRGEMYDFMGSLRSPQLRLEFNLIDLDGAILKKEMLMKHEAKAHKIQPNRVDNIS